MLRPYLYISIAGLLAFAPVSFMLRALKNDIITLEYPINYFISQSIHNGEIPYWLNTWGMGFPLQSTLTWGIFSSPQIFFSSIFNYNIYTLHIEFMFFVLLAGWGMYYLLQKYFLRDEKLALLFSICYMLSGFTVGSSQWLLYITAASFIPILITCLLNLLRKPSVINSFQFAVVYTLMFTSVYAAFNIITTYCLLFFIIYYFVFFEKERNKKIIGLKFLSIAGLFTLLLCLPCMYFTVEVLNHINRGGTITSDQLFFSSNYLHPAALGNLLFPFSSVKMGFANTEGTMLHSYLGLSILLLLPVALWQVIKEKNKIALLAISSSLLFLLISFGEITPLRSMLNALPGFSHFRNPAIFRLYFIIAIIIFLSITFRNKTFKEIFQIELPLQKFILRTIFILLTICILTIIINWNSPAALFSFNILSFFKNLDYNSALLTSAFMQSFFLIVVIILMKKKRTSLLIPVFIFDLVTNTLICTPFFSVSSHSISELSSILHSRKGFPVQTRKASEVPVTFFDNKNNAWYNINIFSKEIATNDSYLGPLVLDNFISDKVAIHVKKAKTETSIFLTDCDSINNTIKLLTQRPSYIQASIKTNAPCSLTVLQNFYSGWKAFYNKKEVEITSGSQPGMSIQIPEGEGVLEFKYERKSVWIAAILLHFIIFIFLIWKFVFRIRKHFTK